MKQSTVRSGGRCYANKAAKLANDEVQRRLPADSMDPPLCSTDPTLAASDTSELSPPAMAPMTTHASIEPRMPAGDLREFQWRAAICGPGARIVTVAKATADLHRVVDGIG